MPTDTLKIKERLTARGNFTPEQTDGIIGTVSHPEDAVLGERA